MKRDVLEGEAAMKAKAKKLYSKTTSKPRVSKAFIIGQPPTEPSVTSGSTPMDG